MRGIGRVSRQGHEGRRDGGQCVVVVRVVESWRPERWDDDARGVEEAFLGRSGIDEKVATFD